MYDPAHRRNRWRPAQHRWSTLKNSWSCRVAKSSYGFLIRIQRNVLGNPEVQELRPAIGKHNVAGFQVSVDDPYLMKRFQRGEQRQRNLPCFLSGKGTALDATRQRFALNELHHQDQAVLLFRDVVNPAGIRMSYLRRRARLLTKSAAPGIVPVKFANPLERHDAPQPRILRLVPHSHSPSPNFAK